jgi:hypothetical protein
MHRREDELRGGNLGVVRGDRDERLPAQAVRARKRHQRSMARRALHPVNVSHHLVTTCGIGILGFVEHLDIDRAKDGFHEDEVVVAIALILNQPEIGLDPRQTIVALGVGDAPERRIRRPLLAPGAVQRRVPKAEFAIDANDRTVELHAPVVRSAARSARQNRIAGILFRTAKL